jgi:putative ABC transport system ATP-binding protein
MADVMDKREGRRLEPGDRAVLEARALRRRFGAGEAAVEAVRGIDLALGRGEIVLIMGPSGSGKTTLLSMLGGLLRPTSGTIEIGGVRISDLGESQLPAVRAHRIGFVFQDFNLMPSLTAQENVEVALNVAGVRGARARDRAVALLTELELGSRLGFLPEKLSGGEKQRVSIARAFANEPDLVLADEPTANLDSSIGRQVMRNLREIAKRQGHSVLIVSHDDRIKEIADRVLWLEDGVFKRDASLVRDPVCGMAIDPDEAPAHLSLDGADHWFCSQGCRAEFEAGRVDDPVDSRAPSRTVPDPDLR